MSRPVIPSWVVSDSEIFDELDSLFAKKLRTDKIMVYDVKTQKDISLNRIIVAVTKGIVPDPAFLPVLRRFLEGLQEHFDSLRNGTVAEFDRWVKHFEHVYSFIDDLNSYVDGVESDNSFLRDENARLKKELFVLKNKPVVESVPVESVVEEKNGVVEEKKESESEDVYNF